MNTHKLSFRLSVLGSFVLCGLVTAYGCSSGGSNNPGPSSHDAGNDTTSSSSGGTASSSGGTTNDSGGSDAPVIDTGSCTSDASTCNSCYTASQAAQDPLNACAPETANCIPFTGTVPSHPTL